MLDYEPDNLAVLVELNETLIRMGQIEEAADGYEHMSRLLVPVPDDVQTWLDRTLDALNRRDAAEAESSAGILGNLLVVDPAYRASRDRLGDPSQQSPPLYDFRSAPFDLAVSAADTLVDMKFEDAGDELMGGLLRAQGVWTDLAVADVDGDGRLDLALAGPDELFVVRNRVAGWETVSNPWSGEPADSIYRLSTGDFDNDGDTDVFAAGNRAVPGVPQYRGRHLRPGTDLRFDEWNKRVSFACLRVPGGFRPRRRPGYPGVRHGGASILSSYGRRAV